MLPNPRLMEYGNVIIRPGIKKMQSDGAGCTMALLDDGRLFATGPNGGQYGIGAAAVPDRTKWTLVRENVDDVCCNQDNESATFVIRQGNVLFYSGSVNPVQNKLTYINAWTLIQDLSTFLTDPDDYIKDIKCSFTCIVVLIRNERSGSSKVLAQGDGSCIGDGIGNNSYGVFTLSTTAPPNVAQISLSPRKSNVYLLTEDNIMLGCGQNGKQQFDNTNTYSYNSYIEMDVGVYKMWACVNTVLYIKAGGVYIRSNSDASAVYLPAGTIPGTALVTPLQAQDSSLYSNILLTYIHSMNAALYVPANIQYTAPTANGVNWGNSSNKQFTIINGAENKEVQELVGGLYGVLFKSNKEWYAYTYVSQQLPPNVNGVIIVPD